MLKIIESRLKKANQLLVEYDYDIESEYNKIINSKKSLVVPINCPNEQFIANWYEKYPGAQNNYPFYGSYFSNKGERMRSKSEKILADMFERMNIPYVYEPMIILKNEKIVYPDFILLNANSRKTVIYEHFGLMSNAEYSEKAAEKILLYIKSGYVIGEELLFSLETQNEPLDLKSIEGMLKKCLNL